MIRFTLLGVPVRIQPSFWLAVVLWGVALTGCEPHPIGVLYFSVAAFVVMLMHELGHAVVGRFLIGAKLHAYLTFIGSFSCSEEEEALCSSRARNVITILAGPALGGLVVPVLIFAGLYISTQSLPDAAQLGWRMLRGEVPMEYAAACPPLFLLLLVYMLQISVFWTILNLLPIYPLDGGLIFCELTRARGVAHGVSLVATLLLSMLFFASGVWALSLLMVILAFYNYRCIYVHSE